MRLVGCTLGTYVSIHQVWLWGNWLQNEQVVCNEPVFTSTQQSKNPLTTIQDALQQEQISSDQGRPLKPPPWKSNPGGQIARCVTCFNDITRWVAVRASLTNQVYSFQCVISCGWVLTTLVSESQWDTLAPQATSFYVHQRTQFQTP